MKAIIVLAMLSATQPGARPIDRSPEAARTVVRRYYAAIDRGDYRAAYPLWNGGKDYPAFVEGFARTARTRVVAGAPTDEEGAAGSLSITVPVRVDATLKNGTRQHFAGSYVLRRINDVPGATADQLRWHISAASLHPVR